MNLLPNIGEIENGHNCGPLRCEQFTRKALWVRDQAWSQLTPMCAVLFPRGFQCKCVIIWLDWKFKSQCSLHYHSVLEWKMGVKYTWRFFSIPTYIMISNNIMISNKKEPKLEKNRPNQESRQLRVKRETLQCWRVEAKVPWQQKRQIFKRGKKWTVWP